MPNKPGTQPKDGRPGLRPRKPHSRAHGPSDYKSYIAKEARSNCILYTKSLKGEDTGRQKHTNSTKRYA